MNEEVRTYIGKYGNDIKALFNELRGLIYASTDVEIEEKLWARLPSYYYGDSFVRLIPFKDHINIEAAAISANAADFSDYSLTPKGMLKLGLKDAIPRDALIAAFRQTLKH